MPDRDVSAAGYYGMGNALYRLDRESEARQAWERATGLGETPGGLPGLAPGGRGPGPRRGPARRAGRLPPVREARSPPRTAPRSPHAWAG